MIRSLLITILVSSQALVPAFERSLFIAPLYIGYLEASEETFATEARELKDRLRSSSRVRVGFAAGIDIRFPNVDETLREIDFIVQRAYKNDIPIHINIGSGFFHSHNALREAAIREDVRNAQWFADGSIAPPKDLTPDQIPRTAWVTPSRYALQLRRQIEDGVRRVGGRIAANMERYPETLLSTGGDGEVELSFERTNDGLLADFSPFAVAEFRDWIRERLYNGDLTPASDENRDGRIFNKDFGQNFRTWNLRYYNESGPIPYTTYLSLSDKLPHTGNHFTEAGFDAPRSARQDKRFQEAWQRFRIIMVANYVQDFAEWITVGERIPASRFFSYQIPADFLFGQKNSTRAATSASPLITAFIQPVGSVGVTAFNTWNGKSHSKTASRHLFEELQRSGPHWGIMEYNPSVPAVSDHDYYLKELRTLYRYHPRVIVPFAWNTPEIHKQYEIKGTAFESALQTFLQELAR